MAGGSGLPTSTAENPNATGGMGGGNATSQRPSSLTPTYYNTNPVGINYEAIFNPATRPAFDEESYLTQKAQQLQRTGYQGPYTGTTNADLRNYITNVAGMSLQDHYSRYGRNEGLNPYITGKTEQVPVSYSTYALTPQQQANYLTDLSNQYNQRMQASMADARQQRVARAQAVQADYNTKKAQAEAQAAASNQEAINRAVQEALAQQQSYGSNNDGYGFYTGAAGGIASLAKGFKK